MLVEGCVLNIKKAGIELLNGDEIFVQVKNSINYWISNYGRLVSNLHKKYKLHKFDGTNIHYTIVCYLNGEKYYHDTYTDRLVAEAFLEKVSGRSRIHHIDGNQGNSYYKNLIYVNNDEYYQLTNGVISIEDLNRNQQYKPYITIKNNRALSVYNSMYMRCYDAETKKMFPHYRDCTMYEGWKQDKDLFIEWFEQNYYQVLNEASEIDKDLLFKGNKIYSPSTCCILPQTLNRMLSNCVKPQSGRYGKKYKDLPLGVSYDEARDKYYGFITMDSRLGGEKINLGYYDTPDEAFAEYKRHKQAYILMMADLYKNHIPKNIYQALLKFEVMPYAN